MNIQFFLVRGLARESAHWGEFPGLLNEAFPGSSVRCLEIYGSGKFWRKSTPWTMGGIARGLRSQFLDFTNQDEADGASATERPRNIVVSMSLGAMATLDWVSGHPGEVDGVVLMNTSVGGLSPFLKRLQPASFKSLVKVAAQKNSQQREAVVLDLVSNNGTARAQAMPAWTEIRDARPVSVSNSLRQIIAAASYFPGSRIGRKSLPPTLILKSEGDRMVDPSCSDALAGALECDLRAHPHAGHDLTLDDADWVVEQLREWISEHADLHDVQESSGHGR